MSEILSLPINRASFKFTISFRVTTFVFAKYFEVFFVDVLACCLFSAQPLSASPAFVEFDELWAVRVPDYIDEVSVRGNQYGHVIATRMRLAIGIENLQGSSVDQVVAE